MAANIFESPANLWRIVGTLETTANLHIGDGRLIAEVENCRCTGEPTAGNVRTFVRDANGKPFIPGSELKGAVSAWLDEFFAADSMRDSLLGAGDEATSSCGGKVTFCNAYQEKRLSAVDGRFLSYYQECCGTFVRFGNSIERWSNTAKQKFLYATELVPIGTTFRIELLAKNLGGGEKGDTAAEVQRDVEFLLRMLDGFNREGHERAIRIGAGQQNGWGAFRFSLTEVAAITASEAFDLATADLEDEKCNFALCKPLEKSLQSKLKQAVRQNPLLPRRTRATLGVELVFDDGFLIQDPAQTWLGNDSAFPPLPLPGDQQNCDVHYGESCSTPLLDHMGKPVVTAETLRGVLRSRAERILKTLVPESAWSKVVTPIGENSPDPSLIDQVFGTAGRASTIELQDLMCFPDADAQSGMLHQDHVAINRISGGGADRMKFDTVSAHGCKMKGELSWDLRRVTAASQDADALAWQAGLLALVLMDACDGDLSLGQGKAKGLGRFRMRITSVAIPEEVDPDWSRLLQGIESLHRLPADSLGAIRAKLQQYVQALVLHLSAISGATPNPAVPPSVPHTEARTAGNYQEVQTGANEFLNSYQFVPMLASASQVADDLPLTLWDKLFEEQRPRELDAWRHLTHAAWLDQTGPDDAPQPVFHGTLRAKLRPESDLVVGGQQDAPLNALRRVYPFRLPCKSGQGWELAVPATSFRGMLSSVAEAASNSALRVVTPELLSRRASVDDKEALPAVGMVKGVRGQRTILPLCLPALSCNSAKAPFRISVRNEWQQAFDGFRHEDSVPPLRVYLNAFLHDKKTNSARAKPGSFLADCAPATSYCAANQQYWYLPVLSAEYRNGKWFVEDEMRTKTIESKHGRSYLALGHKLWSYVDAADIDGWPADHPIDMPLPEARFNGLPEQVQQRLTSFDFRRGIFRMFGLDGDKYENLPPAKKHEWFIPLSAKAEAKRPRLDAEDAIRDFETLVAESPKGAYQLLGVPERSKELNLQDGDLVCFDIDRNSRVTEVAISSLWRKRVGELHELVTRTSARLLPVGFESNYPEIAAKFNDASKVITLAEQMFGFVEAFPTDASMQGTREGKALASRVHIRNLRPDPEHTPVTHEAAQVLRILDAPKLPSPSMYFLPTANERARKKTELLGQDAKLRGRKFYLHGTANPNREQAWTTVSPDEGIQQKAEVTPVKADGKGCFEIEIAFDNLTQRELGLLCYALSPTEGFWHKLGMGKSLGLGSVSIADLSLELCNRRSRYLNAFADSLAPENPVRQDHSMVESLRNLFRNSMPDALRIPLELIGCCHNKQVPVHNPLRVDSPLEDKSYEWFVQNEDRESGRHEALPRLDGSSINLKPMRKN